MLLEFLQENLKPIFFEIAQFHLKMSENTQGLNEYWAESQFTSLNDKIPLLENEWK